LIIRGARQVGKTWLMKEFGRTCFESNSTGLSYEDAIKHALQDIPVIYDADVGHTVPRITMINGAILHLQYKNGKAALQFKLK